MSTEAATQTKHNTVISSLGRLSIEVGRLEEIIGRISGTPGGGNSVGTAKGESMSLGPALISWPVDIDEYSQRVRDAISKLEELLY